MAHTLHFPALPALTENLLYIPKTDIEHLGQLAETAMPLGMGRKYLPP
jgi:hypothetical protein